jgi:hypothetical protein
MWTYHQTVIANTATSKQEQLWSKFSKVAGKDINGAKM